MILMAPTTDYLLEQPGRWKTTGRKGQPKRPLRSPHTAFILFALLGPTLAPALFIYGAFSQGNLMTGTATTAIWLTLSAILFRSTYDT